MFVSRLSRVASIFLCWAVLWLGLSASRNYIDDMARWDISGVSLCISRDRCFHGLMGLQFAVCSLQCCMGRIPVECGVDGFLSDARIMGRVEFMSVTIR